MKSDKAREDFEYWASDDGENPAAVERSGDGYKLAQIQTYWQAWLAAKEKYEPKISGYGCHCDLEPNQSPDGCVIDEGRIHDCVYAKILSKEGKVRDDCEYWQPIREPSTQGEE